MVVDEDGIPVQRQNETVEEWETRVIEGIPGALGRAQARSAAIRRGEEALIELHSLDDPA